ncbi:MAG: hypothetical protein COU90_01335 [Candidatus Ryanbacteria bacterium CG10_big_fil_rev_8_21_14_0_10_43_42]|uniref:Uncharacterized protein n=1 Tax=Candidatus Ryanbacteria bacterium CG10_big_fil_rev_8_21_14_0_10_43_42 TaxID=1974864 RepID=A0A2M8KXR0_9BACT|nr:MAG: hypothetical protein COU90_01335 [Candidatus Ryanbacteria bacterium CG10_big_fil_rev_8_21_14_0_10_43_42]
MSSIRTTIESLQKNLRTRWHSFRATPERAWGSTLIILLGMGICIITFNAYVFWAYVKEIDRLVLNPPVSIERLNEYHFTPIVNTLNTKQNQYNRAIVKQSIEDIFRQTFE